MGNSSASPEWTEHDVSDPGITLLQALVYAVGAVVLVAASATVLRRRRRSGEPDAG
jgi:hypothetical protein